MVSGFKGCRLRPASLFLFLLLSGPAYAADIVDGLIQRAREERLASDPYWSVLLHYKGTLTGVKSRLDDPNFFLSPRGKTDPEAELEATLRGFYAEGTPTNSTHALCRFPARFSWLKDRLQIDPSTLPFTECEMFERVREHLEPHSAALIFPAAFMNSPASMFGHTLVVIDAKGKDRLLSQAVTYAARTDNRFGPFFAFAGIMGLYPGYYTALPYYERVNTYSGIEHRDLWEYQLNLTPEEVDRMLRHAWEVQNLWSRYFFFSENCSYNLYYLLDAARPGLNLTAKPPLYVIPVDTIKTVEQAGLITKIEYRASKVRRLQFLVESLSKEELRLVRDVAKGVEKTVRVTDSIGDPKRQMDVLDAAAEYVHILFTSKQIDAPLYRTTLVDVLKARSKLGARPDDWVVPAPDRPDYGHDAGRISLGGGSDRDGAFASLKLRPANHELIDNNTGFDPGAQIMFMSGELRVHEERDALELRELTIVDVFSLAPRSELFHPRSWKFSTGFSNAGKEANASSLAYRISTGFGRAWKTTEKGLLFAMLDADARVGDAYNHGYAAGMGPSMGCSQPLGSRGQLLLSARWLHYAVGEEFDAREVRGGFDLRLSQNWSATVEGAYGRIDRNDVEECSFRVNHYF